MTIRRLFTYIWRINAVLILFVGGLAAVALIYSLYHLAKDVTAQTSVYGKLQTNDSGASHWLFPTRDWLCLDMQEVPHSDFQKLPVKRIFYTIGAAKTSALKLDHDFAKM